MTREVRKRHGIEDHICRACFRDRYEPAAASKPAQRDLLALSVLADLHLGSLRRALTEGLRSAKDFASIQQSEEFDRRRTVDVLEEVRRGSPDLVLLAGDYTLNGTPSELAEADRLGRAGLAGLGYVAAPGNHDFWTASETEDLSVLGAPLRKSAYPRSEDRSGVRVVTLCSPDPPFGLMKNAIGLIGRGQLERLDAVLGRDRSPTVVLVHHPFRHHQNSGPRKLHLRDAQELEDVLAGHRHVAFVVAGHLHEPWICRCGPVPLVSAPSAGRHQQFLTLEVERSNGGIREAEVWTRRDKGGFSRRSAPSCDTAKRAARRV